MNNMNVSYFINFIFCLFIYLASRNGNLDTVKLLIQKGANINEKAKYGSTALILGKQ